MCLFGQTSSHQLGGVSLAVFALGSSCTPVPRVIRQPGDMSFFVQGGTTVSLLLLCPTPGCRSTDTCGRYSSTKRLMSAYLWSRAKRSRRALPPPRQLLGAVYSRLMTLHTPPRPPVQQVAAPRLAQKGHTDFWNIRRYYGFPENRAPRFCLGSARAHNRLLYTKGRQRD